MLIRYEKLPRREGFLCPELPHRASAGSALEMRALQPGLRYLREPERCARTAAREFATTRCLHCFEQHPMPEWIDSAYGPSGILSGVAAK